MAIEVYRDAALSVATDILSGTDLEATLGSETVEALFLADDSSANTPHYKFVSAVFGNAPDGTYDYNGDGADDIFVYVAPPVLSTGHTQQIIAAGGETTLTLDRKFIKPGTFVVQKNTTQMAAGTYTVNYLAGKVYFDSALTASDQMDFTFDHGDDGVGNVNQPSNAAIKANGSNTRVGLWDVPERGDGAAKGAAADGVPFFVLVELGKKVLDFGDAPANVTDYDLYLTRRQISGAYDG